MPKEKGKGKGQAMPKGKGKGKGTGKGKGKKVEGGKSTVVNGLPTTLTQPQAKFCRASSSCRTENALVRICFAWASMIKIPPNGRMPSCRILWFLKLTLHRTAMRMQKTSLVEEEEEQHQHRHQQHQSSPLSLWSRTTTRRRMRMRMRRRRKRRIRRTSSSSSSNISPRIPSKTQCPQVSSGYGKEPGDRRRSAS